MNTWTEIKDTSSFKDLQLLPDEGFGHAAYIRLKEDSGNNGSVVVALGRGDDCSVIRILTTDVVPGVKDRGEGWWVGLTKEKAKRLMMLLAVAIKDTPDE
jgi:hypothetical protein